MGERPTSRRRAATRERLMDAAWSEFTERGFAATSIEHVCDRAGFTRGAFYSNFATKEELFLALHRRQSARVVAALEERRHHRDPDADLATTATEVLAGLAPDRAWHLLRAEFLLHASRDPAAAAAFVSERTALRDRLGEILAETLEDMGRRLTVPVEQLADWLLAVDDGGTARSLVEPVDPHGTVRSLAPLILAAVTETAAPAEI